MKIIAMDYETYASVDLKAVGAWKYANHQDTEPVCLAWNYNYGEPYLWTPDGQHGAADLEHLFARIEEGWLVYAWNATFEYYIWNYCCVPKFGWPRLKKSQIFDTMAIAQALGLPGQLEMSGEALGLDIQKDKNGKRLINKLSKPRRPSKLNPATRWTPLTAPQDYADFYKYCKRDVLSEGAIHKRLENYELSFFEREMWLATLSMNEQGIPIDVEMVKILKDLLAQYAKRLNTELSIITDGEITSAGQVAKIVEWLKDNCDFTIPNLTRDSVSKALSDPRVPDPVRKILEIRQRLSKSSTKKFNRILDMAGKNNFVHDILRYHQATTGRWGGTGIQIHNLPRTKTKDPDTAAWVIKQNDLDTMLMFYDDPMELGSKMIRPSICATAGMELIVSDFSGIENRVLCWLADDVDALRLFASGIDQYRWFATKLYPVRYDDVTDTQRAHAKTCILGLGYGMGADKFYQTCLGYGMDITESEAKRSVELYRYVYDMVVRFWHDLYSSAMHTVRHGTVTHRGQLKFTLEDDFLFMHLPSGRKLGYYKPEIQMRDTPWGDRKPAITFMSMIPQTYKWGRVETIPGRLVENATQAVARDILADAKYRLMKNGRNVLFSVHDEIVCHEKIDTVDLNEFNELMCDIDPCVYPNLPLAAEGYIAKRYRKD